MIRIENLSKSYRTPQGRHYVFKDLNIELPTGKSVALIGRNGAGKSTLLRMIGGIDRPDSGRIITNSTISWPVGLAGGFQGSLTGRENVKFIEEQSVEPDSKNVGSTWRFVNIDGSPDRRFKYNHPLPILSYSELTLSSGNILHEVLQFSKPNVGFQLQETMRSYPFRTFLKNHYTTKSTN